MTRNRNMKSFYFEMSCFDYEKSIIEEWNTNLKTYQQKFPFW